MLDRLFALLRGDNDTPASASPEADLQRAAAVLLAIAARLDGCADPAERETILRLLQDRLGIVDARSLVEQAEAEAAESTDFYSVTRVVKDMMAPEQRVGMIEMLWEVAYADGKVHDFEANLIRRVAGLLNVDDRDAGDARKRVIARMTD
jgi:uncharacterized tellurite resistance protein B-like protein